MRLLKSHIATVTNMAYGLAGFALWQMSPKMLWPALMLGILMIGSAIHHYNLSERRWSLSFTRSLDYLGMYSVSLSLIAFGVGWTGAIGGLISVGTSVLITAALRADVRVLGILFAGAFVVLGIKVDMVEAMSCLGWLSLGFGFNYLADKVHRDSHDLLHGISWHVPSAVAAMKAAETLYKALL